MTSFNFSVIDHENIGTALTCLEQANGVTIGAAHDPEINKLAYGILEYAQKTYRTGHIDEALTTLQALVTHAPQLIDPYVELLIISLFLTPRDDISEATAIQAERQRFSDSRIHVLLGEFYFRKNDFKRCNENYIKVRDVSFQNRSFFDWKEQLKSRLMTMTMNCALALRGVSDIPFVDEVGKSLLAPLLASFHHPDAFGVRLAFLSFYNEYGLHDSYNTVASTVEKLFPHIDTERRACVLHYLYSIGDAAAFDRLLRSVGDQDPLWHNPAFARTVVLEARRKGDAALETRALDRVFELEGQLPWRYKNTETILQELRVRRSRLGILRPASEMVTPVAPPSPMPRLLSSAFRALGNSVKASAPDPAVQTPTTARRRKRPILFIGMFGQLRHEADVLPHLRSYFLKDLKSLEERFDAEIRFGISVWDKTGQRPIVDALGNHGGVEVLMARLPPALATTLRGAGVTTIAAARDRFPRLLDHAIEASLAVATVDTGLVQGYFPEAASVDVFALSDFMKSEAALMEASSRHGARPPDWRNQLRMWERVGAFTKMINGIEADAGRKIAGGALVRADLMMRAGSIGDHLAQILEGGLERTLFVDYDPAAIYFEGIGDRFFIGDRAGILAVSQCWNQMMDKITSTSDRDRPYINRFGSHVFVASHLFEQLVDVRHIAKNVLSFEVCRGFLHAADIREPLAQDCAALEPGQLRQRIEAFLAAGGESRSGSGP